MNHNPDILNTIHFQLCGKSNTSLAGARGVASVAHCSIGHEQTQLNRLLFSFHCANMSVHCTPPYTTLLCSKTGVYRGYTLFSYFCS